MNTNNILFLIVVLLTNIIQCITGFAGTVLAMPVSVILIGFTSAKAILNLLGLAASVGVLLPGYKHVNKKELFKMLAFLVPGIIIGYFIGPKLLSYQKAAYILLGSIVILFAVINIIKMLSKKESRPQGSVISTAVLICSGLIHGVFVCGGPLLVTYASTKLKDTEEFRTTLSAIWIVLNGFILISDIKNGYFDKNTLMLTCASLAVLIAAIILGNLIAKKMSKKAFLALSYVLMLISGLSLLFK